MDTGRDLIAGIFELCEEGDQSLPADGHGLSSWGRRWDVYITLPSQEAHSLFRRILVVRISSVHWLLCCVAGVVQFVWSARLAVINMRTCGLTRDSWTLN